MNVGIEVTRGLVRNTAIVRANIDRRSTDDAAKVPHQRRRLVVKEVNARREQSAWLTFSVGAPDDVAYCIVRLASDESNSITGAEFTIDADIPQISESQPNDEERTRR